MGLVVEEKQNICSWISESSRACMQGLSTLTILADRLLKDIKNSKKTNIRDILKQLMDGIVLLGN